MHWLMYMNSIQITIIYLIFEAHKKKDIYILLIILILICGVIEMYSFLGCLIINWVGLSLISYYNNEWNEFSTLFSSLSLSLIIIFEKIVNWIIIIFNIADAYLIFIIMYFIISIPCSLLIKKIVTRVTSSKKTTNLLSIMCLVFWIAYYLKEAHFFYFPTNITLSLIVASIFILTITIFVFILYLYTRLFEEKMKKKHEKENMEQLMIYISEIEKYNTEVRKFRHDYQNILTSIEIFMTSNDMEGLKKYFHTNIKKESYALNHQIQRISDLNKIGILEIKSILANKLMYAQQKGISVSFEASENITKIKLDSIVLVRIIGIILDNAIEEVEKQVSGEIRVGVYYINLDLHFIFENTCSCEVINIHELYKKGYSTKGIDRGQGLANLVDLTSRFSNVFLETTFKESVLIQKVIIH